MDFLYLLGTSSHFSPDGSGLFLSLFKLALQFLLRVEQSEASILVVLGLLLRLGKFSLQRTNLLQEDLLSRRFLVGELNLQSCYSSFVRHVVLDN